MSDNFKYVIATFGIVLALLFIYFGAYLPFTKAHRYIAALRTVQSVKSVEDFRRNFDNVMKFYSPVGDEEAAKFLSNDILNLVSSSNQPEAVSRALVSYIEPYMFKDNVRHLLAVGHMYESLWMNYGKQEDDFKKAEEYYLKALSIGPKLPPVLYGLLAIYIQHGDRQKFEEVRATILRYWPNESRIQAL